MIKPNKIITVRPVWLREPGTSGFINGRSNTEEIAGKVGVYVIFEGIEETGNFEPVYVGASGAKEKGPGIRKEPKGNLRAALLRHFYQYADDSEDKNSLYYKLKKYDMLQERTTYYKSLAQFDYYYRAYIFPDLIGKDKDKRTEIKEAIRNFELEKIKELKPRDNPEPAAPADFSDVPF